MFMFCLSMMNMSNVMMMKMMWDLLIMVAMLSLMWSSNNMIMLLNFLSILMLLSFKLLNAGIIEFTMVIIMVYQSAMMMLFLVNSLHLSNLKCSQDQSKERTELGPCEGNGNKNIYCRVYLKDNLVGSSFMKEYKLCCTQVKLLFNFLRENDYLFSISNGDILVYCSSQQKYDNLVNFLSSNNISES